MYICMYICMYLLYLFLLLPSSLLFRPFLVCTVVVLPLSFGRFARRVHHAIAVHMYVDAIVYHAVMIAAATTVFVVSKILVWKSTYSLWEVLRAEVRE